MKEWTEFQFHSRFAQVSCLCNRSELAFRQNSGCEQNRRVDAEGLKKKFGVLGEPLMLGVIVGVGIGCLTCESWKEIVDNIPYILGLGIKMGAVMELIPRVTVLFYRGSQAYLRSDKKSYLPEIQGC